MASLAALRSPDVVRSANGIRDNDHYHPTGDSIIRVENTLFKIHRAFLTHFSPIFETMFDLPVGMGNAEGSTDDLPIVLDGEQATDFRAALKCIYASPIQIQIDGITIDALPEIISLTKFAHKYEMHHWNEWGLKVLSRLLADLSLTPVEHIPAIYSLYHLVEDTSARTRVMKSWCEVIEQRGLSVIPVIDAADACEDRDGLAEAYCTQIRLWEKRGNIFDPDFPSENGLSQPSDSPTLVPAWRNILTTTTQDAASVLLHNAFTSISNTI
ncbi:hypothetical protein B0H12DRAFT_1235399 [Mycena haematopus]|nr:hypothetical protein B0H12DRAFT_1235399 [Mycena haematopus]